MLKMGDKSLAFVEKAHDYAADNPTLSPSYLDMAAFDVDFADAHGLWSLLTLVKQLHEVLEDTVMAAGSEAFHAALAFYHNVQAVAKDDVPGAKAIFEDLKTRFPGGRRKGGATDETGDDGRGRLKTSKTRLLTSKERFLRSLWTFFASKKTFLTSLKMFRTSMGKLKTSPLKLETS
jgi:hypothetical protein